MFKTEKTIKEILFDKSLFLLNKFCEINNINPPSIKLIDSFTKGNCGQYFPKRNHISLALKKCAHIGTIGRKWSYPGHVIDRTPYGVLQHEFGHHIDHKFRLFKYQIEKPITSYAPNRGEWFAEMFRLFQTNPDLLSKIRPKTHKILISNFKPVIKSSWREILKDAPKRNIARCEKLIIESKLCNDKVNL